MGTIKSYSIGMNKEQCRTTDQYQQYSLHVFWLSSLIDKINNNYRGLNLPCSGPKITHIIIYQTLFLNRLRPDAGRVLAIVGTNNHFTFFALCKRGSGVVGPLGYQMLAVCGGMITRQPLRFFSLMILQDVANDNRLS